MNGTKWWLVRVTLYQAAFLIGIAIVLFAPHLVATVAGSLIAIISIIMILTDERGMP